MRQKIAAGGKPAAGDLSALAGAHAHHSTSRGAILASGADNGHLSAILAAAGAGMVLIPRGEKGPRYKGWQRSPKPVAEALAHARRGGNVGMLGGTLSNNLVLLDFDANFAKVLQIAPELSATITFYRDNAPDRAKCLVRVVDQLPPSQKAHGICEILADGTQGVIFGTHPSGARVEHRGDQILEVSYQWVAALWRKLTGSALGQSRRDQAGPPDAAAVATGVALAEKVLELADTSHYGWQAYEGEGRKAELKHCPFSPADNPHDDDRASYVVIYPDGRIGAGCHHARCRERIEHAGGSGWALLKEIAGYAPAQEAAAARRQIAELRRWIRREDFAQWVPLRLQAINGYRTLATDKRVADALLDVMHRYGRVSDVHTSWRELQRLAGLGSHTTVEKALERLAGWFVTVDSAGAYSLSEALLHWAKEASCVDRPVVILDHSRGDHTTDQGWSIYATSPLATHKAHDAFSAAYTNLTAQELADRNAERETEGKPPLKQTRLLRRRLAAVLPSAGPMVLLLIDALTTEGGSLTRRELAELTTMSKHAVSRAVSRAAALGLVDADRQSVTLRSEWAVHAEKIAEFMPTAGRAADRRITHANEQLRYCEHRMRVATDDEERRRISRRMYRARKVLSAAARAEAGRRPVDIERAAPSLRDHLALKRLAERTAEARIQQSEERHAGQWRLTGEIRRLRGEGVSRPEVRRMLELAGWERREVYAGLSTAWPAAVAS